MPKFAKEVVLYRCTRCGHEWIPKKKGKPKCCADKKCNSPNWDKPIIKEEKLKKLGYKELEDLSNTIEAILTKRIDTASKKLAQGEKKNNNT